MMFCGDVNSSRARAPILGYQADSLFQRCLGKTSSSHRAPSRRKKQPDVEQKRCRDSGACSSPPAAGRERGAPCPPYPHPKHGVRPSCTSAAITLTWRGARCARLAAHASWLREEGRKGRWTVCERDGSGSQNIQLPPFFLIRGKIFPIHLGECIQNGLKRYSLLSWLKEK